MKRVLILAAAVLLISGTGFAQGISGSGHDFSTASGTWNSNGEICQPCHTPHNGDMSFAGAPLWDHEVTVASFTLYTGTTTGSTFDATPGQPAGVSKLCLSCHDGTVALDSFGGTTGSTNISGSALVGTDLSNDHPVSFLYDTALAGTDGGLHDPATTPAAANLLFAGNLECGSCHDVHNGAGISNLLVMSNAASALCLTCHDK